MAPGVLPQPNGARQFTPMSDRQRKERYIKSLVGLQAVAFTFAHAGIDQGLGSPDEWPQDGRGFGYRVASGYAQHAINTTVGSGVAFLLHEDNRYFASTRQGIVARLRYAVASSFLARHDDGSRHLSWSALAGPASGAFISRAWQPPSVSEPGDAAVSFGITEAVRVGLNVTREFAPQFVRRLLR
jgi:hypothetical protein